MGLDGMIKDLYDKTLAGTNPTGAASLTGDQSQMLKALIAQILNGTAPAGAANAAGDISQMVKYLVANIGGQTDKKVQGSGYQVLGGAAAGINPANSGVAWTNGAWSQVVAATSEADWLLGLTWNTSSLAASGVNNFEADIAIGTGGAGSETEIISVPVSWKVANTTSDTGQLAMTAWFPYPVAVANATRIAVRVRSSSTVQQPANIRLIYAKQSDVVGY